MSDVTVNINGHETVSPAAKSAGDAVQGLSDQTKTLAENTGTAQAKNESFIRSFTDIKSMVDMAIGVIKTVTAAVGDLAAEYAVQEKANVLFNTAMSMSGKISKEQAEGLRAYAQQVQTLTGVDDDETLSLMRMLSTSGRSAEEIQKLIGAAVDLSAATGDSLSTTVEQLNKTFSGSAGRLSQMIPELKELSEEALAHGEAIDVVAEKYRGLTASMATLTDVSLKNTKNAFDDAKAAMGGLLMEVFGPALKTFTDETNSLADSLVKFTASLKEAKALRAALAAEKAGTATAEQKALIKEKDVKDAIEKIESVARAKIMLAEIQAGASPLVRAAYVDELSRLNNETAIALNNYRLLTGKAYVEPIPGHAAGTRGAKRGPAVVGERGPEVVFMEGGEAVIPNHMLRGLPGYAGGTEVGNFLGAYGKGGGGEAAALSGVIDSLVGGLGGLFSSLGSITAILNPIQTMLQGLFEVIGPLVNEALAPLVGILKTVGQIMGKLLAPVITFLGDVIAKVAEFLVKIINGIIDMINWVLPKKWEIDRVSLGSVTKAGEATASGGGTTGASASYTKQRDITNYFTVNTTALVGDDGFRQFCLVVGREIKSAGMLGLA